MFGPPVQDRSASHVGNHQAAGSTAADIPSPIRGNSPPIRQGRSALHTPRSRAAKKCLQLPSVPEAGLSPTILHAAPLAQPLPSHMDNPSYVKPCHLLQNHRSLKCRACLVHQFRTAVAAMLTFTRLLTVLPQMIHHLSDRAEVRCMLHVLGWPNNASPVFLQLDWPTQSFMQLHVPSLHHHPLTIPVT
jgi:hypothetical protein